MYKNKDILAEKNGTEIANKTAIFFEQEIARVIQKTYANRSWTPISMEIRHAAIDEIQKIFTDKMLELKQTERDNEWRYQAQDEIYPELKEDLKKFFPGWGCNSSSDLDSGSGSGN
jgi:hypothetical protein